MREIDTDTTKYDRFERHDGLIESSERFPTGDRCAALGRRELFYGRIDALEYLYQSSHRLLLRYNNFKHPNGLLAFMKIPFKTECYWLFRLDGLCRSVEVQGNSFKTFFRDREDRKVECIADLSAVETDIRIGSIWLASLRVYYDSDRNSKIYTKRSDFYENGNVLAESDLSELCEHFNIRMFLFSCEIRL
jgi:hypothetical protein